MSIKSVNYSKSLLFAHHTKNTAKSQTSAQGLIVRDNVWGTIEQDALRRDFSANALYYNPQTGLILDFANGMPDIQAKVLRMIGDPAERYREDPVRMLRAVRFAAKLGFTLEAANRRTDCTFSLFIKVYFASSFI
jgi:tRNA nucleotidyltransferase/poly(A) polymerase